MSKLSRSDGGAAAIRGFTLMEMLLVIGMMVLIIGMTGLWVQRGMFTAGARASSDVFYAASAEARILAMGTGRPVRLRFDEQAQQFVIEVISGADGQLAGWAGSEPLPWEDGGSSRLHSSGSAVSGRGSSLALAAQMQGAAAEAAGAEAPARTGLARSGGVFAGDGQSAVFPLAEGSDLQVTFYALNTAENTLLGEPLEGIEYHPAGVATPVEVVFAARGTRSGGERIRPDYLANGPSLQNGSANGFSASAGGFGGRGGW